MSMPSIATAPGVRIAWAAFSVTTVPPVTTSDTGRRACAPSETAATAHTISTRFIRAILLVPSPQSPVPESVPIPAGV